MRLPSLQVPSYWLAIVISLGISLAATPELAAQVVHADGLSSGTNAVAPASYTTSGSYFSRELGTPLRFGYRSEGYGTQAGVVSLGTMKVFNLDNATWFLDGQGTMSDGFGGGFNLGAGYREMVNLNRGMDSERILGMSFWTDGQNTKADNFFTQLGFGLESLGESFDLRLNGYFPLSRTKTSDPTLIDIDTISFRENELFAGLERVTIDTAHSVIDAEAAKRINDLDAWAIAGVYQLGGGSADDTGYRVGMRGYALPDLALSLQVTDDDIYHTNVMFGLTWFVGRTHSQNAPCGVLADRFREPVWRNDYISTTSRDEIRASGDALTDADTNAAFHFLHVNNNAGVGGDGTFENPFTTLELAEAVQQENGIVYVHGGSVLAPTQTITLLDNVKLLGEGLNQEGDMVDHIVDSVELGSISLPETITGAAMLAAPKINAAGPTDLFVLSDNNTINNFEINNGTNIIVADTANLANTAEELAEEADNPTTNGINAPHLANLDINNPSGTAILFRDVTGTAVVENTVTVDGAGTGMTIDGGAGGMNIAAQITNSNGSNFVVQNRTGGIIAYSGSIQDGAADTDTAAAIILQNNMDAVINFTQTLDLPATPDQGININSSGNFSALQITGNDLGTSITFADLRATAANANTVFMDKGGTLVINDSADDSLIDNTGTGDALNNVGSAVADELSTITVNANVTNTGGGNAVDIRMRTANNVTFGGDVTDTSSEGVLLNANTGGTIRFNGLVTANNVGANNGVAITGGGADVTYQFTNLNIDTVDGTGFLASGDGTLIVTSTGDTNVATSGTGTAIDISGLAIGAGNANFDQVFTTGISTNEGIRLVNIDGTGTLRIGSGTTVGSGGIIHSNGAGMRVENVDNLIVDNLTIDNGTGVGAGTGAGLVVTAQNGGTAAFNQLTVNTAGTQEAVDIQANTGGTITFTPLDAESVDGDAVFVNNNNGTAVNFNGLTAKATGAGRGFVATNKGNIAVVGVTEVDTALGIGVEINDITVAAGGIGIDNVTVTNGAAQGVLVKNIVGSANLITIGSGAVAGDGGTLTTIGDAIDIDNADSVAVTQVTVNNTVGNGIKIHNQNDGNVLVTGLKTTITTGTGVIVEENTNGTSTFVNTEVDATGVNGGGVRLTNNTGATTSFQTIDIDTTSGTGFIATGNGTVSATGTNTITTTTGVGLSTNGVIIGAAGLNFNSVNVTNGASNGITLTDTTGGQVRVGSAAATGVDGTGGTLNTTGNSIVLSGVTNALFNDVTASTSGLGAQAVLVNHTSSTLSDYTFDNLTATMAAGTGNAVVLNDQGDGEVDFIMRNSTINTTASDTIGFLFDTADNAGEVDITLSGNSITAAGMSAVLATIDMGTGDIQFLMTSNTITNNDAGDAAANLNRIAGRNLNATIGGRGTGSGGNTFSNAAGTGLAVTSNHAGGRVDLDLRDNTATGLLFDYRLTNGLGDFGVVDRDDTLNDLNNTGNIDRNGSLITDFENIPSVLQVD